MKKNQNAQLEVLNRFAYMLDEYSVQYLADEDPRFRNFVDNLNSIVDREASNLLSRA